MSIPTPGLDEVPLRSFRDIRVTTRLFNNIDTSSITKTSLLYHLSMTPFILLCKDFKW